MLEFIALVIVLLLIFGKHGELGDFIFGLLSIVIRLAITAGAFGINPILGFIVLILMFRGSD